MKADKPVEFASDRMLQLSVWQRGPVIGNSRFQFQWNLKIKLPVDLTYRTVLIIFDRNHRN